MGIARGTNIITDGLVFGYDTGYGVADNNTATRFYPGKPTTNLLSSTEAFDDTNYWARSRNSGSAPTVTANTSPNPLGSEYPSMADKVYIPDDGTYPRIAQNFTPASTNTHTFSVWIRSLSGDCRIHLIAFRNSPWGSSGSAYKNLTSEWQRVSFSFTPQDTSAHQIYMGAHDAAADKGNTLEFWGAHMEENPEATPYEASSRSNTTSLIDLKRTTSMDVSNVSFDSTGQPTFDGTDDSLTIPGSSYTTSNAKTVEIVFKMNGSYSNYSPLAVYANGSSSTNRIWLGLQNNKFRMHGWGTDDPDGTTTISADEWYVCSFSYDKSTQAMKIYTNGVLESSITNSQGGVTASSSLNWYLGTVPGSWQGVTYSDVEIPIFKIYNRVLSDSEVKQNYNAIKNRFNL